MTDLHFSLFVIGIAAIVIIIGYNQWQQYRSKKILQRMLKETSTSEQLSTPLQHNETIAASAATENHKNLSNVYETKQEVRTAFQSNFYHLPAQSLIALDPMIDNIVTIPFDLPVRGEKLLTALQSLRLSVNKPVHFLGLNIDNEWQVVTPYGSYTLLQVSLQLATRTTGALNELEYSEFIRAIHQISDSMGTVAQIADMPDVINAATRIHQTILKYDICLGLSIQSNGAPWDINTLLSALEKQGFDLHPDNRLYMSDGVNGQLFSLTTNVTVADDKTSFLTLLLDLPRSSPEQGAFQAMLACAKHLTKRLDGKIVDDEQHPLTDENLESITEEVNEFYEKMRVGGIAAGSPLALRLYI